MMITKLLGTAMMALLAVNAMGKDVNDISKNFSPRLATPRIAPIGKEGRTPDQEKMLASRPDYNIYKTLAHDPELYARWSGLGQYLLNRSTLPARDREIVILRMGWLCQAPYEWSQHARIAKADVKMTEVEVHAIAEGATAKGWNDFERTLITMVDELRYDAMISDKTWVALRARYSIEQTIDAIYTAAQYQLVSMALNSAGVQLDPMLQERIPTDAALPRIAGMPHSPRLQTPRVAPLALEAMTAEQRVLVTPQMRDGKVPNLYATLVNHVKFYEPRRRFGSYVQRDSHLPPKTRELVILRTAWLMKAEYEWAHHVPLAKKAGLTDGEIVRIADVANTKRWSEEEWAVLSACDELRREAFISDVIWNRLKKYYDPQKILEIIYTSGGYAMTAIAINSLGIQVEPGNVSFPRE